MVCRQRIRDWTSRYNITFVLIETFVETPCFIGTAYQASGWTHVGTTKGRGRYSDTIHIFERAHAMTPGEGDGDSGGEIAERPDEVDDAPAGNGAARDCYVGLLVGIGESCTYPGTTDEFSVNVRGRGSFLGRLAGIRIRIDNETIDGRVYDFLATHQGEGVWQIDRVAGMT